MAEGQLLTDEALSWIGHQYASRQVLVTEQEIRRFAYASREPADTFDLRGYDGAIEAPPMFYVVLRTLPYQMAPLDRLDADGTISEDLPPISSTRGMAGEVAVEFHRSIRAGDMVTISKKIVDLAEKSGRSGPFVIVTFVTEYRDQAGDLLVRERFARILR